MKSREHVTTNGRAVFFAAMWEDLKSAAISHGWALGLHGSLVNDMDIMAMAWDEHASTPEAMIEQLCICFSESSEIMNKMRVTTDMPNNRVVYTLPIWADFYLDINVISSQFTRPSVVTQSEKGADNPRDFLIMNYGWIEQAVDNGMDIRLDEIEILSVMSAYAKSERSRAREETIEDCIKAIIRVAGIKYFQKHDAVAVLGEAMAELENLKSRQ